ncbi:MAG TPA: S41 family peptidase [Dysgonamonadaceae bacterium]|nr:S41 family peptidase [Dysgonamonadaceae bacterium]
MRKISSLLLIILTLLLVVTSCSEKDDPIVEKGDLIRAIFNPSTKSFTLKYSKGSIETIDAEIDNSVTPPTAKATLEDGTIISVNDATKEGEATIGSLSGYQYVNNWIYKEMNIYYLWNDLIPKKPDFTQNPNKFFDSLLNTYDKNSNPEGDRFSWIDDNYRNLLGSLSGIKSDEIGFEYIFAYGDASKTKLYAIITYPKLGSDAYNKGIDRGRFITQVDGKDITNNNYRSVFSGTGSKTLSMADWVYSSYEDKYKLTPANNVTIRMEKNFAEAPIYLDSVYTIGDKKIGYMVYNFFATDKGDDSHDYDRLLMNKLANIKSKGATEMVLDLRYNGGGAVSTAIALASALVKERSTNNVLVTAEYNNLVHAALLREENNADYNKDYFIDKIKYGRKEIAVPALNLPRLYVLVTGGSASASEFIINGLKPYMDVILIGETTYGKNVGSISIYEKDDPKNEWGLQPIIVKFSNSDGESDFTDGFVPDFQVNELKVNLSDKTITRPLVEFGNTEDPLLSKAIEQITGKLSTRSSMNRQISTQYQMNEIEGTNSNFKNKVRFEMYDDVRGKQIKELMKK